MRARDGTHHQSAGSGFGPRRDPEGVRARDGTHHQSAGSGFGPRSDPEGGVPGTARITNLAANLERSEFEDFAALELMDLEIGHGIDAFLVDQLFFTRLEMGQPDIGTMPGFQYVLAQ